jgi:hypothetical protein
VDFGHQFSPLAVPKEDIELPQAASGGWLAGQFGPGEPLSAGRINRKMPRI